MVVNMHFSKHFKFYCLMFLLFLFRFNPKIRQSFPRKDLKKKKKKKNSKTFDHCSQTEEKQNSLFPKLCLINYAVFSN